MESTLFHWDMYVATLCILFTATAKKLERRDFQQILETREIASHRQQNKRRGKGREGKFLAYFPLLKQTLRQIILIESRTHKLAVALGITIRIQLDHPAIVHVEPPRPRPHLLRKVHPPLGPLMLAIDRSESPARDSFLVDDDATADTLAFGSEQPLGAPVAVIFEAKDDTAPDVNE